MARCTSLMWGRLFTLHIILLESWERGLYSSLLLGRVRNLGIDRCWNWGEINCTS